LEVYRRRQGAEGNNRTLHLPRSHKDQLEHVTNDTDKAVHCGYKSKHCIRVYRSGGRQSPSSHQRMFKPAKLGAAYGRSLLDGNPTHDPGWLNRHQAEDADYGSDLTKSGVQDLRNLSCLLNRGAETSMETLMHRRYSGFPKHRRFRPQKIYIFLIRTTSRVDTAMSVWALRSRKLECCC